MDITHAQVTRVRESFGLRSGPSEDELERICVALELVIGWEDLPGGLPELLYGQRILLDLRVRESLALRRWWLAHALGHHLLHRGNQLQGARAVTDQQERQANLFAAWLLFGYLPYLSEGVPPWEIADEAGVPEVMVRRWIGVLRREWFGGSWAAG